MGRFLVILMVAPVVELALLIEVGRHIGTWPVIFIIALTALIGAALTRGQGFGILNHIRRDLREGTLPADSLIDGVMVLLGGVLLLTPGLISDAIGFTLLIPVTRGRIKAWIGRKLRHWVEDGSIRFFIR